MTSAIRRNKARWIRTRFCCVSCLTTTRHKSNTIARRFLEEAEAILTIEERPDLLPGDLFDQFCHWLVAIKRYYIGRGKRQYWKIAPGEHAAEWDACLQGGYIAIGWPSLGDLTGITKEGDFEARAKAAGYEGHGVKQVWRFLQIPEGAYILANKGTTSVVGVGQVSGGYYFVPDDNFPHRLPVEWLDTTPRRVNEPSWRKTLIRLKSEDFARITGRQELGGDGGSGASKSTDAEPAAPDSARSNGVSPSTQHSAAIIAPQRRYTIDELAQETSMSPQQLSTWIGVLERRKRIILQSPPGTGKTFLALRLARHLVSETKGFVDKVQFHPAYGYEEFIQGLRPTHRSDDKQAEARLQFDLKDGKFLFFCKEAARPERGGAPCVLIIDEINRANLPRVS
jgi:5-methylcytosine-specific restriction protein B